MSKLFMTEIQGFLAHVENTLKSVTPLLVDDLTEPADQNDDIPPLSDSCSSEIPIISSGTSNNPESMTVADALLGLVKRNTPRTAQSVHADEIII